jgi:hypothetical protein
MAVDDVNTVCLMHLDGADGSNTFIDESGKVWTVGGGAQLDTAQYKFGTASGLFNGTDATISTAAVSDFNYGSGDFTIDMQVYINATGTLEIFNQGGVVGSKYPDISLYSISKTSIGARMWTGSSEFFNRTVSVNENMFNHIAIIRYGDNFYLTSNGILSTAVTKSGAVDYDGDVPIRFGLQQGGSSYFNGWLDEVRFSKGVARWTSDFTPPTNAYRVPYGNHNAMRGRNRRCGSINSS